MTDRAQDERLCERWQRKLESVKKENRDSKAALCDAEHIRKSP
jgi:hypothetical protein